MYTRNFIIDFLLFRFSAIYEWVEYENFEF